MKKTSESPSLLQSQLPRRSFLGSVAAMGAIGLTPELSSASQPTPMAKGKIKLGFDNFSIRALNWKAPQLIAYAKSLKVDTLLMSDLRVYESFEDGYLTKIKDLGKAAGIELHAGTGSICPTSGSYNEKRDGKAVDHARKLIRTAKKIGSNVARCYLGSRRDRRGDGGIYPHIEETVKVLKAVQSEAEDLGVKFAVENHAGDLQAWELVELIKAAGTSFVGATVDAGNATWTLEDPVENLRILGPHVLSAGIRDTALWETGRGAKAMWANMGQGVVDWEAYVKLFKEVCPKAPFVLEIISYKWANEAAFLEPDFWKPFPKARAHEFARYVALAKKGKPYKLPEGRPGGNGKEAEQAQQKFDLEQSVAYCKKELGLGLR